MGREGRVGWGSHPLQVCILPRRSIHSSLGMKSKDERLHVSIEVTVLLPRLWSIPSVNTTLLVFHHQHRRPLHNPVNDTMHVKNSFHGLWSFVTLLKCIHNEIFLCQVISVYTSNSKFYRWIREHNLGSKWLILSTLTTAWSCWKQKVSRDHTLMVCSVHCKNSTMTAKVSNHTTKELYLQIPNFLPKLIMANQC